jgi:CRISPR-associated protein Cmr5
MSNQRTLEQERASAAWKFIQEDVKKLPESVQKEYASLARKAPADIQTNGLGQTLAFWRAKGFENGKPKDKGENAHYQLLHQITEWLNKAKTINIHASDVVEWVSKTANVNDYRRATTEAIAFLVWLKRFAESDLP